MHVILVCYKIRFQSKIQTTPAMFPIATFPMRFIPIQHRRRNLFYVHVTYVYM